VPLLIVARKRRRPDTARKFAVAALCVAAVSAIISFTSDRLVAQCEAAGNPACIDSGSAGMKLVIVAIFAIVTWVVAYLMYQD
jgi:hypothetical protein